MQRTYDSLFRSFRRRAPMKFLKWLPLFLRHPWMLAPIWESQNRRVRVVRG